MKKIIGLLDVNNDGEINALDMSHMILRHEWLLVAALFIAIGALGKVIGWWYIDSDLFWAAAGVAAIFEYIDDTRRIRKAIRKEEEE
jgi:hypothetical protein|tara:strand:+ start:1892 stop:2152 length:261 start_codon:yes stop_codon:yes gene_type:complete